MTFWDFADKHAYQLWCLALFLVIFGGIAAVMAIIGRHTK